MVKAKQSKEDDCRLEELVQYNCVLHSDSIVCQPIERFFRRCRGRPAVEVTKVVEMVGGKPYLPAELRDAMPPSNDGRRPR